MKKTFGKTLVKILSVAVCSCAVLSMNSCHDPIFEKINEEVALEKLGINGDVMSFTRFGDYIYLSNGRVYYKTGKSSAETGEQNGQWDRATLPLTESNDGYEVPALTMYLASDSTTLYALTYMWKEDTSDGDQLVDEIHLFATTDKDPSDGTDWIEVNLSSIITGTTSKDPYSAIRVIFDNQAYTESERKAYVNVYSKEKSAYTIYRLNGTETPTMVTKGYKLNGTETPDAITAETDMSTVCSTTTYSGKDFFANYHALASTENGIYYSTSATSSAYTSSANLSGSATLHFGKSFDAGKFTTYTSNDLGAGSILSIAPAANALLLGTSSGLGRVNISTDGTPESSSSDFSSNGDSIISEYVFKVFVLDPSKQEDTASNENGTDEYAASTIYGSIMGSSDTFSETGLYAYYPSRHKWNRDGTSDTSSGGN